MKQVTSDAATDSAPSRPSLLQAELARRIADDIRSGVRAPGDHLTEEALSQQYAVSRTPVRAALQWLQQQGFVEARSGNRGGGGVLVSRRAPRLKLASSATDPSTEQGLYAALLSDRAAGRLAQTFSEAEVLARYAAPKQLFTRVMLRLTGEGLAERRKGHGWTFTPMLDSREALTDSYRFRMLIECGGLREAGFAIDPEACARARAAHERFIGLAPRSRQPAEFFEMNAGFHEMLARFSGNRFIEQAVRQQNQLRRFEEHTSFVTRSINLVESCQEHLQIIDALESGDRDWAAALLQHHLSSASRF